MSNQLLGNVYSLIMNDVIENCQTTFEEDGVNQQTLGDLRSTWQTKLTALHVGSFPWEPQPAPQPMAPTPMPNPTVPSNVPRPSPLPSNSGPTSGNGQPRIKQEPNVEPQQFHGMTPGYNNNLARERAAQQLQQRFGQEANAQISRLQQQSAMNMPAQYAGGQPQPGMHRPAMGGQYPQPSPNQMTDEQRADATEHPHRAAVAQENQAPPNQMTEKQRADAAEYQRRAAMSQAPLRPQAPPQQQQPAADNARTDGADEWEGFVAQRRVESSQASGNIFATSETLRQHLLQQNKSMEGGGLMLPLAEQPNVPPVKKRKIATDDLGALTEASSSDPQQPPKVQQFDGTGDDDDNADKKKVIKDELFDDDDDDEDAINSDLDDPADTAIEEEEDEGRPNQIMLCTYDKVQRVKNKWKCVLKDGVLNTGGKDYVFTKANGEFEW